MFYIDPSLMYQQQWLNSILCIVSQYLHCDTEVHHTVQMSKNFNWLLVVMTMTNMKGESVVTAELRDFHI